MGNVNTGGKAFVMGNIVVNGKIIDGDSFSSGDSNVNNSMASAIQSDVQAQIAAAIAAAKNGNATVIDGDFVAGGKTITGNLVVNGNFIGRSNK